MTQTFLKFQILALWFYLSSSQSICENELLGFTAAYLNPSVPSEYSEMVQYSGLTINNLGDFDSCRKLENAEYALFLIMTEPIHIVRSICGPKSCTESDYLTSSNPLIQGNYSEVILVRPYQKSHYKTFKGGAVVMLSLIGIITLVSIIATLFDYFSSHKNGKFSEYLLCFSIIKNGKNLLSSRKIGDKSDTFDIFDSIRVMSIGWILLGHMVFLYVQYGVLSNYYDVLRFGEDPNSILPATFSYGVESFFWVSAFLFTYFFLLEINKMSEISLLYIAKVYLNRFLRITPTYMFCLTFVWSMIEHIGSGPFWVKVQDINEDCEYWYGNLLYINNFIPNWRTSKCIPQAWFLAVDMQCFAITPIILIIYSRISKGLGWAIIVLLFCVTIATTAIQVHYFNLSPGIVLMGGDYLYSYYGKPYSRVVTYAFGIAGGIILYSFRKNKQDSSVYDEFAIWVVRSMQKFWVRASSFIFGLLLINAEIFCLFIINTHPGSDFKYDYWSETENIFFISTQRFTLALGLTCLFLPLLLGHFKLIIDFLAYYPWTILGKLTFSVYLIHYAVIQILIISQKHAVYFGEYTFIRDTVYFYLVSVFFAIPIYLLIESPSVNISKLLLTTPKPPSKEIDEEKLPLIKEI